MDPLTTIAITGTNGKTTTTTMVAAIVEAACETPARVTTVGMWVGQELIATEAKMSAFEQTVALARDAGVRTLALEVTSRALADGFARQFPADIGVFTNLSHDHLDRHGSPEAYLAAKAQLFLQLRGPRVAILNQNDPASALLVEILPQGSKTFWFRAEPSDGSPPADLAVSRVNSTATSLALELESSPVADPLGGRLEIGVGGAFNAGNALAAALAAHAAGYSAEAILRGLAQFRGVPGRFQVVSETPLVIIDFAHSPDALERVLSSSKRLAVERQGKLRCLFGCGGERDEAKRPVMGEIADRLCDVLIVTTDNPRSEDPERIASAICAGTHGLAKLERISDRNGAIHTAISEMADQDVLVIAGRGPETVQQVCGGAVPLSDADSARAALKLRGGFS